jgi:hypothetical protein
MKPVTFKEHNVIFAKDQKEYLPLPAYKAPDGTVVSCWKISLMERVKVLVFGRLWLSQLTFNSLLQPQRPSIECPFEKD